MKMREEKIFTPRDFLAKYQLPQLVCIHEAHLQQVNESRPRQVNRSRLASASLSENALGANTKSNQPKSILASLTNNVRSPKQSMKTDLNKPTTCSSRSQSPVEHLASKVNFQLNDQIKSNSDEECKDEEIGEEVFAEELVVDEEVYRNRFTTNTLASSDSGMQSAASSNCSENQYPSNSSPECNSKKCVNGTNETNTNAQISSTISGANQLNKQSNTSVDVRSKKKLLDLDQPFLLYKSYSSRQVIAHILDVSSAVHESLDHFQRTGPALLIPESYSGWFALVTSTGQTAGYFTSIEELACSQVPYFMSRDCIWAIPSNATSSSLMSEGGQVIENQQTPSVRSNRTIANQSFPRSTTKKVFLPAGTSFRFLGLYEDVSSLVNVKKSRFSTATRKTDDEEAIRKQFLLTNNSDKQGSRYIKCLALAGDQLLANQTVFIPTNQTGRFYVICKKKADKNSNQLSYNHVYKLSQLLKLIKLPATVQLVVGQRPREYNAQCKLGKENRIKEWYFSAVLRLEQFKIRDVILAATMRPQPFKLESGQTNETSPKNKNSTDKKRTQSLASTIRKSLLNHSMRKIKKRKTSDEEKNGLGELIEEDGAISTENGDLAILLEFDLDSNFKFIPYRTELNNLISNSLNAFNRQSLINPTLSKSSLHSNIQMLPNKSISFISQLKEQLPKLVLQRISFCDEHSDRWRQQIKLAHGVIPRPPPLRLLRPFERLNKSSTHTPIQCTKQTAKHCSCDECQFKRTNGMKSSDCRMPSMDNILLRANEFNTNLSSNSKQSSNFKITQLFNRLRFNSRECQTTVDLEQQIKHSLTANPMTKVNSGATSLPLISVCSQSTIRSNRQASTMRLKQTNERKLKSSNSIRLMNASIGTLRTSNNDRLNSNRTDNSLMNGEDNQDSLLYKRMLSYSTHSLEPNVKQTNQDLMSRQTVNNNYRFNLDKTIDNQLGHSNAITNQMHSLTNDQMEMNVIEENISNCDKEAVLRCNKENEFNCCGDENKMMRLLGKHSDVCSDKCCEAQSNERTTKMPKIKLNRDLNMMQASLNNYRGTNFLRKSSMFSKSLDSLANSHLYETLESMNTSRLQHRISRKRTLNTIFPQINLKSNTTSQQANCLEESNEDLSNEDLSNDESLDSVDELEIDFRVNPENINFNLPDYKTMEQHTEKVVLKKQAKVRQRQQPIKLMKDSVQNQYNNRNSFLVKKNSFLSNYGSESDEFR